MSKGSLCHYDPLFVPTPDLKDPFSIPHGFLSRDYNSIDDRPVGTQVKVNKRWYEKKSDDNYYLFINQYIFNESIDGPLPELNSDLHLENLHNGVTLYLSNNLSFL